MRYLQTFESWDYEAGSGSNPDVEDLQKMLAYSYVANKGKQLKEYIESNDISEFKSKLDHIIKYPEIFQGYNHKIDGLSSNTEHDPDKPYMNPTWPHSLSNLMNILMTWCIKEGSVNFVEYLLDVYDYESNQLDEIVKDVERELSQLPIGDKNDLYNYNRHIIQGARKCIDVIHRKPTQTILQDKSGKTIKKLR